MTTVTVYGKPDCHLCDEAVEVIRRVGREIEFELIERDITTDDRLHRAYLERIPVICVDGRELFDFFVDEELLRSHLTSSRDHLESGQ